MKNNCGFIYICLLSGGSKITIGSMSEIFNPTSQHSLLELMTNGDTDADAEEFSHLRAVQAVKTVQWAL